MKTATENILCNMLYATDKPKECEYVIDLFDAYTTSEITEVQDLFKQHKDFVYFIRFNKEAFVKDERDGALHIANRRTYALLKLNQERFYPEMRKHLANFSHEVEEVVAHKKDVKILEVGGGNVPYSSILLGQDGYDISAMDAIYLSNECMQNLKVKSYRQMFNHDVKLKDFDVVVARRPCTAIQDIVEICSQSKVPYFMRLCACDLPSDNIKDWQPILRRIDPLIHFENAYAFNFNDASFGEPKNIEEIIEMDTDMDRF